MYVDIEDTLLHTVIFTLAEAERTCKDKCLKGIIHNKIFQLQTERELARAVMFDTLKGEMGGL